MDQLNKKNKILNYSIASCCFILTIMCAVYFSNGNLNMMMGNTVYSENDYNIGDIVNYSNSDWYFVGENEKSITLLKKDSLTKLEIDNLNLGIDVSFDGAVFYDYGVDCNENDTLGCTTNLTDNTIGNVLTTWQNNNLNIDELVTVGDYTIRLINNEELTDLKNYDWLYLNSNYFTMSIPNYSGLNIYQIYSNKETNISMVYEYGLVRPVINVSKGVLNKTNMN